MSKVLLSKVKYIEMVNRAMQEQPFYQHGMQVKGVAANINPRGFIEVSQLPNAKVVLDIAIAEVNRKYTCELE